MPLPLTPRRLSNRKSATPAKGPPVEVGQPTGAYDSHSVRERVRQWQAQGGGVVITEDIPVDAGEDPPADERAEAAARKAWKKASRDPGRQTTPKRQTQVEEPRATETHQRRARREKTEEPETQPRTRSASAPRRRIVSDEHWRSSRVSVGDNTPKSKRKSQPSWALPDDGIRVRPMPDEELRSRRRNESDQQPVPGMFDDGIRVYSVGPDTQEGEACLESAFGEETCTNEHLSFHSPTPSERYESGTYYSCDVRAEVRQPGVHRSPKDGDGQHIRNYQGSRHIRFAEPEKPPKKSGKRLSKSGILSNVLEESKKIFGRAEPPSIQEPRMPTIESWLNGTPDPFVDGSSFGPGNEQRQASEVVSDVQADETPPQNPPPDRRKRHSRTRRISGDANGIWDALNTSSRSPREGHDGRQHPHADRTPPSMPRESIAQDRKKDALKKTGNPATRRSSPELDQDASPSSPSSLRRRGAHKKTGPANLTGRSNLGALKAAFMGESQHNASLLSSADSGHSSEATETIAPLRPRDNAARRSAPNFGTRLSTIASMDTLQSNQQEARQSTESAQPARFADSELQSEARDVVDTDRLTRRSSKSRITKHADLMSILSQPRGGAGRSIRSARSVHTTRSKLEVSTLPEIMSELAADEAKYMRELRTLVDGVIPVLLSSILSKSEAAVTVGLFSNKKAKDDPNTTKPIYDMGLALERLKRAHKRVSLERPESFLTWARSTQYIYWDYLQAWRMGFQDVVVNLAPADPKLDQSPDTGSAVNAGLERNESGDVVNSEGERVDVAFLLKRPLVRLKQLSRTIRNINAIRASSDAVEMDKKYQGLVDEARNRVSEERARLEDEAAAAIDATRARDPRTLAPLDEVAVNEARRVRARDCFNLTLYHTTCQVIDCRVELLLREDQQGKERGGDVLVCEIDGTGRWLLFPPINTANISARNGDQKGEIVVMIRGTQTEGDEWYELLSLLADEEEAGFEWVQMLGLVPIPPGVQRSRSFLERQKDQLPGLRALGSKAHTAAALATPNDVAPSPRDIDVPLGEHAKGRRRRRSNPPDPPLHNRERAKLQKTQTTSQSPSPVAKGDAHLPLRPGSADRRPLVDSHNTTSPVTGVNTRVDGRLARSPRTPEDASAKTKLRKALPEIVPPLNSRNVDEKSTPPSPGSPKKQNEDDNGSPYSKKAKSPRHSPLSDVPIPDLGPALARKSKKRPNSPLKNEYEPSTTSASSSESDSSSIRQDLSSASDSDDADLEDGDIAMPLLPPGALNRLKSAPARKHSSPGTIAPSESASQAPYKQVPAQPQQATKTIASIFYWSDTGGWDSMHPDECSIVVTPGLIEAFMMSALHSKLPLTPGSDPFSRPPSAGPRPLIGLELTPLVPIRRGTALDISVRSPPTPESTVTHLGKNANILFRSRNPEECEALYALINNARIHNPTYIALQNARATSLSQSFGGAQFNSPGQNGRNGWFGLGGGKSSYRASSAPTPSADRRSGGNGPISSTGESTTSAFSALRRFGLRSSRFSIARSTITSRKGGSHHSGSVFSSSEQSSSSGGGASTPTMPATIAGAMGVLDARDAHGQAPIGLSNAKIRLYIRETASKWRDLGAARLTIMRPASEGTIAGDVPATDAGTSPSGTPPPLDATSKDKEPLLRAPGSGQPSASDKRVLVTHGKSGATLLDVTLGESCFERVARTGIAVSVWESVGAEGTVGKVGGVTGGKLRVYMIQMEGEKEAAYTFGIVGRFRY